MDSLPEPFISGSDQAGEVPLNILNVVQLACERIQNVDNDDLPVGLALV